MRKIDLIIVHCSATPEGKDFTRQTSTAGTGSEALHPSDIT